MVKRTRSSEEKMIELVTKAAENKLAVDLKVLDVRKSSPVVDFIIICGAESEPQIRAIEKEIDEQLRKHKVKGFRWQGQARSGWALLDLGPIVVHIMGTREREYYDLDGLWGKDSVVFHY